jgi:hypothetical protein
MFSASKSSAPVSGGLLSKSLRFRSSASAYLNRTYSSTPTNLKIQTFSFWVKRGSLDTAYGCIGAYDGAGSASFTINFKADNTLQANINGSQGQGLVTTQVFRDTSAWYHIVFAVDTTQATASNRTKLYVNGVQVTVLTYAQYPPQNDTSYFSLNNSRNSVGSNYSGNDPFSGYLTDVYFIDGQQLTPSSFGATDATTGQWSPAKYTGTYGTNGFHLTFANATSTTTLGYDTSGNSNNWTTNNISLTAGSTYDSMNDVPVAYSATAANYAVLNPLNASSNITISNGNLNFSYATAANISAYSTIGVSSGKWYTEVTWSAATSSTATVGITLQGYDSPAANIFAGSSLYSYGYDHDGKKYNNSSGSTYGATFTSNDVIGIAFDASAGTLTFYKNGTSQGTAFTSIPSGTYFITVSAGGTTTTSLSINFGQQPFTYTPPTGFVALNTYNLSAPTIAQGNTAMNAITYTGDGTSNRTITTGLQSDFVWIKRRDSAVGHLLFDVIRGAGKTLRSQDTGAESNDGSYYVQQFNSNNFLIGNSDGAINTSGGTYVSWVWKGGGTAVSNTSGSITSSVSASTTAGFSIVTYTNASSGTVGHGLGVAPAMVIYKDRTNATNWIVLHQSLTNMSTYYLTLNTTNAVTSGIALGGNPTSSVIYTNTNIIQNGAASVAYCFAQVAGFSAFGSYTGNGSATAGPFVYLGFRPKYIMFKNSSIGGDWDILDTSRSPYNQMNSALQANGNYAEASNANYTVNYYSNGFQPLTTNTEMNGSGNTIIYMAFAENPFKYANAR